MKLSAASALIDELMELHGLKRKRWKWEFDTRETRRLGLCDYSTKTIHLTLGFVLANGKKEIQETILHEIAHALVGKNTKPYHGNVWRTKAISIGCSGETRASEIKPMLGHWVAKCSDCRKQSDFTYRAHYHKCDHCKSANLEWFKRRGTEIVPVSPPRVPSWVGECLKCHKKHAEFNPKIGQRCYWCEQEIKWRRLKENEFIVGLNLVEEKTAAHATK